MPDSLQAELRGTCRANADMLAELISFYMPTMAGLGQLVRNDLPYTQRDVVILAERSLPYLARAGAALRRADELVVLAGTVEPVDDPRLPSPLMRAIAESLLTAITAKSAEELRLLPLISTNRVLVEAANPRLKTWLAVHVPVGASRGLAS